MPRKGKRGKKHLPRGPVSQKQWRKLFVLAKQGRLKGGTRKARQIARRAKGRYKTLPKYRRRSR